ncbi:cytochrome c1 [Maribrevibacterium harenarium]|uniref:Cytochrome c1 n=1 Tax=Maribrevibacterium harenarium TaxID=2589817 RepID=A0A501X0K6_9GAMM|nr:cytochrome c1 [Maribrevibacterium harenarium]TPE52336.1 cytochrome c1 [Maribrevibacterium harenarium]
MKKIFATLALAVAPMLTFAAGGAGVHLEDMQADLHDKASLQRGLQIFSNYCAGCHDAGYARYERAATDLGIPADIFEANLLPAGKKIGDLMSNAMAAEDGKGWFGAPPPDLTLEARLRGEDWVYTYLKSFYEDETRPWGVNNTVFPNVGMPNVLEHLQGVRHKTCAPAPAVDAHGKPLFDTLTGDVLMEQKCDVIAQKSPGQLSEEEFDRVAYDVTNFLVYMGEPSRLQSESLGLKVLLFIVLFGIFGYLLSKEYWRDIDGH